MRFSHALLFVSAAATQWSGDVYDSANNCYVDDLCCYFQDCCDYVYHCETEENSPCYWDDICTSLDDCCLKCDGEIYYIGDDVDFGSDSSDDYDSDANCWTDAVCCYY